jgi:hypothetical protein
MKKIVDIKKLLNLIIFDKKLYTSDIYLTKTMSKTHATDPKYVRNK